MEGEKDTEATLGSRLRTFTKPETPGSKKYSCSKFYTRVLRPSSPVRTQRTGLQQEVLAMKELSVGLSSGDGYTTAAHLVPYETLTLVGCQGGSESTGAAIGVSFLGSELTTLRLWLRLR